MERVASQTPHEVSWTPLLWAMKLLAKAKADDKIPIDPPSYANLQGSFEKIESVNRKLLRYAWVNFPLAYTQVRCKINQLPDQSIFSKYDGNYILSFSFSIYLQVANLAVLSYFIAALFSRQYLIPDKKDNYSPSQSGSSTFPDSPISYNPSNPFNHHTPDVIFPFFTVIELICYMGWIQVAESLLNPFGGIYIANRNTSDAINIICDLK